MRERERLTKYLPDVDVSATVVVVAQAANNAATKVDHMRTVVLTVFLICGRRNCKKVYVCFSGSTLLLKLRSYFDFLNLYCLHEVIFLNSEF